MKDKKRAVSPVVAVLLLVVIVMIVSALIVIIIFSPTYSEAWLIAIDTKWEDTNSDHIMDKVTISVKENGGATTKYYLTIQVKLVNSTANANTEVKNCIVLTGSAIGGEVYKEALKDIIITFKVFDFGADGDYVEYNDSKCIYMWSMSYDDGNRTIDSGTEADADTHAYVVEVSDWTRRK